MRSKLNKFGVICIMFYVCYTGIKADNIVSGQTLIEQATGVRQLKQDLEAQREMDLKRDLAQRFPWDWGGYERFSFLTFDDIDNRGVSDKRRTQRVSNTYLWGNMNVGDIHNFYMRLHLKYIDWNQGDEYRSTENQFKWNLEEGFNYGTYTLSIDRALKKYFNYEAPFQMKLTAGRFRSSLGNQMVYTRRANGVQLEGKSKWLDVKLFGFRNLNDEENIDFSVPGFRSSKRFFYGTEITYNGFKQHRPYAYALIQEDDSGENIEVSFQDYEYDSRYYGIGSRGRIINGLRYDIEGVLEDGKSFPQASAASIAAGESPDNVQIDAWALDANLAYTYNILTKPRFTAEYLFGSGDSDRVTPGRVTTTAFGNKEGTTDRGFLGFGYKSTGNSLAPRLSNLQMLKFGTSFTPSEFISKGNRSVRAEVDFFLFRKDKKEAAISDFRADRPQRNIGKEFDVNITWQIFSDLKASVNYGRFYPGNAYSDKDARDYVLCRIVFQF
ncbi:hypothetical protein SCALIN_C38_0024 [Candidatus Scalindua japonica]|uniref:Alginate export domain-containing protein n=1 Tax=Candidatus Scalindua japonica TaxID=1284222 RepID=A0A286U3K3_9BACT|nr:alginate export family protein [Candidatus Scalindua japonica]GAX62661.1 hypothetical protein SCALIN_C38_0024 [Candidatus Scalindua japonica]